MSDQLSNLSTLSSEKLHSIIAAAAGTIADPSIFGEEHRKEVHKQLNELLENIKKVDEGAEVRIKGYKLVRTCEECPEQYEIHRADNDREVVAYLRLRHGCFTVEVPDCGGELIYEAHPQGDGEFKVLERPHFLRLAVDYIDKHYGD